MINRNNNFVISDTLEFLPIDIQERTIRDNSNYKNISNELANNCIVCLCVTSSGEKINMIMTGYDVYINISWDCMNQDQALFLQSEMDKYNATFSKKVMHAQPFQQYKSMNYYVRILFPNPTNRKEFIENIKDSNMNILMSDDDSSFIQTLFRNHNIYQSNWNVANNVKLVYKGVKDEYPVVQVDINDVHCMIEDDLIHVPDESTQKNIENLYQNLISIYWDIESYCPDTRPSNVNSNSDNNKGSIVLNSIPYIISMSHWNYGKNKENFNVCLSTRMFSCMDKKIIVPNLNIDNIYFDNNTNTFNIYVRDTCDLLISFAKLIKYFKPDIMSGFNDNQYDWAVINNTAHNLNIEKDLMEILDIFNQDYAKIYRPLFYAKELVSKGYGFKINQEMSCPKDNINIFGTIFADTMMVMRKIYPNDRKYGLNHFLQKLNLDLKHDVSYNYIKKYYELSEHSNDYVENIEKIMDYCVNDSISCGKIWSKRNILTENIESAKISGVSINASINYANSEKIINMVTNYAKMKGIEVQHHVNTLNEEKYYGAYVINPEKELHKIDPIGCLDVMSLYPSIMMCYNLSHESVQKYDSNHEIDENDISLMNQIENMQNDYYDVKIRLKDNNTESHIAGKIYWHNNIEDNYSLLPSILKMLLNRRIEIKKELKQCVDPFESSILDAQQYALKIFMNTFYGITGDKNSPFYNILIASSITIIGQEIIESIKKYCQDQGFKVIYGDTDSVYVTPQFDQLSAEYIEILRQFQSNESDFDAKNYQQYLRENDKKYINISEYLFDRLCNNVNNYMHQITGNHRICLEFEGTLYPSMFMAKKKYAGYKYQPFSLNAEKMIKGLEIIKNNHSHIVKELLEDILDDILNQKHLAISDSINKIVANYHEMSKNKESATKFLTSMIYRSDKENSTASRFANYLMISKQRELDNLDTIDYVYSYNENENCEINIGDNLTEQIKFIELYSDFLQDNNAGIYFYQYLKSISKSLQGYLEFEHNEQDSKQLIKKLLLNYKLETPKSERQKTNRYTGQKKILSINIINPLIDGFHETLKTECTEIDQYVDGIEFNGTFVVENNIASMKHVLGQIIDQYKSLNIPVKINAKSSIQSKNIKYLIETGCHDKIFEINNRLILLFIDLRTQILQYKYYKMSVIEYLIREMKKNDIHVTENSIYESILQIINKYIV